MTIKGFDCVEMKRKGSLKIYEETKGMSIEQQVEYWRKRNEEFRIDFERRKRKLPRAKEA